MTELLATLGPRLTNDVVTALVIGIVFGIVQGLLYGWYLWRRPALKYIDIDVSKN